MIVLGDRKVGATVYCEFDTFGSAGESITISGLAVTDIEVYKNGSTTQRASDNGYTLLDTDGIDFDGEVGCHGFSIDTSDNSVAGFYSAEASYRVIVSAITVNGQTVRFSFGFTLGMRAAELVAIGLDHIVGASVSGSDVVDNSIIAKLVSKSATADWDTYNNVTDSLENHTDLEAALQAMVDSIITTLGTAGDGLTSIPNSAGVTTLLAELAKVPKSDGSATWNATALASILTQATAALNAISQTALARFATVDTGQVTPSAGSVAKLAQGSASGGLQPGNSYKFTNQASGAGYDTVLIEDA